MEDLKHWKTVEDAGIEKLRLEVTLDNFPMAMDFVQKVGSLAEMADHHPDIFVEYTKVTLTLYTHDTGALLEKDFALARQIESFFQ